jgi:glycosyltransferase involved in cell wall biosynthesis
MKVLFLMIAYPDVSSNTNMYTDLTTEFLRQGHDVYVAAPDSGPTRISKEGGMFVLRINTLQLFKTSIIKKGIANFLLPYQYLNAIKKHFEKQIFDLTITPTPPITFRKVVSELKKKHKSKVYLILRDIFPQNARDLGIMNNYFIFLYFRHQERKLYQLADAIGCMSQGNIKYIKENNRNINFEKLHLLPNWTSLNEIEGESTNILSRYNFDNRFIILSAGNFGIPQKMEFLIDVAEHVKNNNNIGFVLVGDGTEKNRIKKIVKEKDLKNVLILDMLPRLDYLRLLKESDAGVVTLSDKFTIPNIPSRTLSYWSLKKPVLAAIDRNTDFGDILESCSGGLWSIIGNVPDFINNIYKLYNDRALAKQMGQNGFNLVSNELNPGNTYNIIINNIQK